MNVLDLMNSVELYFDKINQNKQAMLMIIIIGSIFAVYVSNGITKFTLNLFNSVIFKFILFVFISFVSNKNPSIGILLAIITFTILQIVTNYNLNSHEGFKHSGMKPVFNDYEDYLQNPLLTQNKLNPITSNLDLKLENPDTIYKNMIKKGRVLLDDSIEINKDLEVRPDIREREISKITKRDGLNLVESGLNRLQISDQGEYNMNNNNINKFIKYDKLVQNYVNNPQIMSAFNELKYNFNKLQTNAMTEDDFNNYLNKVYDSEIELLELIYKSKKDNLSIEKQNEINNIFSNIKNIKVDKNIKDKPVYLLDNIKTIVEYLS